MNAPLYLNDQSRVSVCQTNELTSEAVLGYDLSGLWYVRTVLYDLPILVLVARCDMALSM